MPQKQTEKRERAQAEQGAAAVPGGPRFRSGERRRRRRAPRAPSARGADTAAAPTSPPAAPPSPAPPLLPRAAPAPPARAPSAARHLPAGTRARDLFPAAARAPC
eukprot:2078354-Rhodomonas_salina.2